MELREYQIFCVQIPGDKLEDKTKWRQRMLAAKVEGGRHEPQEKKIAGVWDKMGVEEVV